MGARAFIGIFAAVALVWSAGPACSSSSEQDCSTPVDLSCQPSYPPTFDHIFENTLHGSCALSGTSCHAPEGRNAGVSLGDVETGYRSLLDNGKVVAGKPQCSVMVRRVTSKDPDYQMPPGKPITDGEQCAIIQWIAAGANR